jgi:hypothetical protein
MRLPHEAVPDLGRQPAAGDPLGRGPVVVAEPDAGDWLVPLLPAASQPGSAALRAVPMLSVRLIIAFIMPTLSWPITGGAGGALRLKRVLPLAVLTRLTT